MRFSKSSTKAAWGIASVRGVDVKLNCMVVIKVLAWQPAGNAMSRQRFLREAQAAAAISHHHVVAIYCAVDEWNGRPDLVMEYLSGSTLHQKIDRGGALQLAPILRIGTQIASGLAAAHAQGLVHRDIKPANILLENGIERIKIADFGLARSVDDVRITQAGAVYGTPLYMSLEQGAGRCVDQRSDLFSLGSVLYAMSTGRPPFCGDTGLAVLRRVCDDTPRLIREVNQEIPESLVKIVNQLLAKDPDDRYQTAGEVARAVEPAAGAAGARVAHSLSREGKTRPIDQSRRAAPVGAAANNGPRTSRATRLTPSFAGCWSGAAVLLMAIALSWRGSKAPASPTGRAWLHRGRLSGRKGGSRGPRNQACRSEQIDEASSGGGGPSGESFCPGRRFQHGWQGGGPALEVSGELGRERGGTFNI